MALSYSQRAVSDPTRLSEGLIRFSEAPTRLSVGIIRLSEGPILLSGFQRALSGSQMS
jgi:hypothetical protein